MRERGKECAVLCELEKIIVSKSARVCDVREVAYKKCACVRFCVLKER